MILKISIVSLSKKMKNVFLKNLQCILNYFIIVHRLQQRLYSIKLYITLQHNLEVCNKEYVPFKALHTYGLKIFQIVSFFKMQRNFLNLITRDLKLYITI